ncbi:MAG TPA: peptidoglycan DD-metalloendopeptidase family protein [Thermoanaerobaculia bacterium]|jgi:septal ring factor EnvC (AmiA/AmiB activator)|nr:peptidoglycan DD-metalloendopeptidase family protein [Thermoanaerobaculia bacterium]
MTLRSVRASLFLVVVAAALPLHAAQPDPRVADLERLRGEIAQLQSRLARAQERSQSLAGELEQTSLQLELQERKVDEAHTARTLAEDRAKTIALEVGSLETRLLSVRTDLRGRLSGLYRLGRAGYLRLLLALAPGQEVLPAMRQLRYLARRDGELLARFHETRARLTVEQGSLASERQRVEGWVRQEEQRRAALATTRAHQAELLARAESERKTLETKSGALEERAQKLSNLLAFLFGQNANSAPTGKSIAGFRGVLDWPVEGRVTAPFGPRLDPRYGTRVPHHGVDLATRPGSEVHAVFPGKVAFAAPFQGYGQTVIVQHAGRAFTLYAGLAETRAAAGGMVSLGQVVGTAGDSLYFEIRIDNKPEDPRLWLREQR